MSPGITSCYYDEPTHTTVDVINPKTGLGLYGKHTLEETRAKYPAAKVITLDEAVELTDAYWSEPFALVTETQWNEAFECLPPERYFGIIEGQAFASPERTSGSITTWGAEYKGRHYLGQFAYDATPEVITAAVIEAAKC